MAKMQFDALMAMVNGRVGNYVFRRSRGRMFISARTHPEPRPPTETQLETRATFKDAVLYTNRVLGDPAQRAVYDRLARERSTLTRALVMGDFLHPPVVERLDLQEYQGRVGDEITIQASDDIEVVAVKVVIRDASTTAVIEEGAAAKIHGVWVYTATTALAPAQLVSIEATALDRPGNTGVLNRSYP